MRKGKAPKRFKEPHTAEPHKAIILAVDTSTNGCHVSLWLAGTLCSVHAVDTHKERCDVLATVKREAEHDGLPYVCVFERPWGGPMGALAGMLGAWRDWQNAMRDSGVPKSRVVRVYPATWQARCLGPRKGWPQGDSKEASKRLGGWELRVLGRETCEQYQGNDNATDAVLIGRWASTAPEVWHALPARSRERGEYEATLRRLADERAAWVAAHKA